MAVATHVSESKVASMLMEVGIFERPNPELIARFKWMRTWYGQLFQILSWICGWFGNPLFGYQPVVVMRMEEVEDGNYLLGEPTHALLNIIWVSFKTLWCRLAMGGKWYDAVGNIEKDGTARLQV